MTGRGPRGEAVADAEAFAASLRALPEDERERWVDGALRSGEEVPYAVVRDVVAPVLARRVAARDPDAAVDAASLMAAHPGRAWDVALPGETPRSLLRAAVAWRSDDPRAAAALAAETGRWFAYAMHELPAGVLCGSDAATAEEAYEMLGELGAVAGSPRADVWRRVLEAWAAYVSGEARGSFEAVLEERVPDWRDAR